MSFFVFTFDNVLTSTLFAGLTFLASMLVTSTLAQFILGKKVVQEFQTNKVYRPYSDPWMGVYLPFISPFVAMFLQSITFEYFRPIIRVSAVTPPFWAGVEFGFIVWLVSTFHGLFMDYCCYKISFRSTIHFWLCTGVAVPLSIGVMTHLRY